MTSPPTKILGKTPESIYFSCKLHPAIFKIPDGLEAARNAAALGREDDSVWTFPCPVFYQAPDGGLRQGWGAQTFQVRGHGDASGYHFLFANDDIAFKVASSGSISKAAVYVQLRAQFIWTVEYRVAVAYALDLVARMFGEVMSSQLSRIDITVDVQGWDFKQSDLENFVTRSRKKSKHSHPMDLNTEHFRCNKFTGAEFSRGNPIMCRIYDKTQEIHINGSNTFFYDLWRANGWDGAAKVWRVEFQLRREVLREMGLNLDATIDLDKLDAVYQYCVQKWMVLGVPGKEQRCRWKAAPEWEIIASADFGFPGARPVMRRTVESEGAAIKLSEIALGCLTALAARCGIESKEIMLTFLIGWLRTMDKGELDKVLKKKSFWYRTCGAVQRDGPPPAPPDVWEDSVDCPAPGH